MSYIFYNPNPKHKKTTDCVIRMLTKTFDLDWSTAYLELSKVVLAEYEMPSSNFIWEKYLITHGFEKMLLPSFCPDCMTIKEFADLFSNDIYVVCTGSHTVAVQYGNYYDAWDSGNEVISYIFIKSK